MEIKISTEDLKGKSIFLATPMYGGQCAGLFTKSTNDLSTSCAEYGIPLTHYYLFNESLVTRARNYCVDEFLRSDCTHLLFVDSDIGFSPKDVFTLLHLADPDEGKHIVCGPYPKKTIAWEKIKKAVDMGFANDNPFALDQFMGDYVFNPAEGVTQFRIDEPVKVRESGTGFMMITREAFEIYKEAYPELQYRPDHVRTEQFDGNRDIMAYFDCIIDPESRRYLSEDYMFCHNSRKAGIDVWLCPWMQLRHIGSYIFGGSLAAMAAIQASPTADADSNKKSYTNDKQLTKDKKSVTMNKNKRRSKGKRK